MKRLNSYLLTHYPLLWNLRAHYFWPLILGLHALFFLWGFGNAELSGRYSYRHFEPGEEIVTLAVLLSLITLVLWLALFFRNNALKSFYPLKRGRLAAEAGLIFLSILGLASFAETYKAGGCTRVRIATAGVNLEAEKATLALGQHFLPYELLRFSRFRDCDGETAQARPVAVDTVASQTVLTKTDTFSYLNFCEAEVSWDHQGNMSRRPDSNTGRAIGWLLQGKRDSVEGLLLQYLALVEKYGGRYSFDTRQHVDAIFSRPDFPIRYTIRPHGPDDPAGPADYDVAVISEGPAARSSDAAPELEYGGQFAYIEYGKAQNSLDAIRAARRGAYDAGVWIVLLYIALGATILIFSFRLTGTRTWFFAVIGAGLWLVLIGLLVMSIREEKGAMFLVLLLEAGYTAAAVAAVHNGWKRRHAGMLILWSLAGMPFFLPLLWNALEAVVRPADYYYSDHARKAAPLYDFLDQYEVWCIGLNIPAAMLLLVLCYIPLARKWQAMPVE